MNFKKKVFLSILSGLLFVPAWFSWGSGFLLFFAFIPMLWVTESQFNSNYRGKAWFWLPFLSFLVWNILTTWWIKNASFAGMITAVLVNSFFMTLPYWLFTLTLRKLGRGVGYFSLLFYWTAFEFLYLNAEISWTWLNLGNGFSYDHKYIQWYEYTGVLGGSFWVLAMNLLLFKFFRKVLSGQRQQLLSAETLLALLLIALPVTFSLIIYNRYTDKGNPYEIVVAQPNIDPYLKFNDISPEEQMDILMAIADSLVNSDTDYFVAPETFLNDRVWLENLNEHRDIRRLKQLVYRFPELKIIIGATTLRLYDSEEVASLTARPYRDKKFYDSFNSALQIDRTPDVPVYHKSELVVGVEKMPYAEYLGFLRELTLKLGGTFRSHGTQDYREAFASSDDSVRVGPVICYESIFGEFVTDYVKEAGANLIFVITNDGWWGNTPGYRQHNSFSSLRAIENRRSIARSANTGISSFFNQRGDVLQKLGWWERGGLKQVTFANDELTFYTKYGDYIGRISLFTGVFLILYTLVGAILKKPKA